VLQPRIFLYLQGFLLSDRQKVNRVQSGGSELYSLIAFSVILSSKQHQPGIIHNPFSWPNLQEIFIHFLQVHQVFSDPI